MARTSFLMILAAAVLLAMSITASGHDNEANDFADGENEMSIQGKPQLLSRFRSYLHFGESKYRKKYLSCYKNASVCATKYSKGPSCCKGRCTNFSTDKYNCGKCGHSCRSGKTCCNGKCVSTDTNPFNCGSCNQACLSSEYCFHGLCNYSGA